MSVDIVTSRTASDVLKRVKRAFGDEDGVQITNSDLFDWMNDGQIEIARTQRYDRRKLATDVISGVGWYPIDKLNLLSIESVYCNGNPLPYLPLAQAEDTIYQEDPAYYNSAGMSPVESILKGQPKSRGLPQLWTLDMAPMDYAPRATPEASPAISNPGITGSPAIFVWPVPEVSKKGGLLITAVRAPGRLEVESDRLGVPDKYFTALVQYVLAQAYELDEDHEAAMYKRQEMQANLAGQVDSELEEQQRVYPVTTFYPEGW